MGNPEIPGASVRALMIGSILFTHVQQNPGLMAGVLRVSLPLKTSTFSIPIVEVMRYTYAN